MEESQELFGTALFGYRKAEVLLYLKKLTEENQAERAALLKAKESGEEKCAALARQLEQALLEKEQLAQTLQGGVSPQTDDGASAEEPSAKGGHSQESARMRQLIEQVDAWTQDEDRAYVRNVMRWIQQRLQRVCTMEEQSEKTCRELCEEAQKKSAALIQADQARQKLAWAELQATKERFSALLQARKAQLRQQHALESSELEGMAEKMEQLAFHPLLTSETRELR